MTNKYSQLTDEELILLHEQKKNLGGVFDIKQLATKILINAALT